MGHRKALDVQASVLMLLLCMTWGVQQVVLKIAADDITPLMQIALRCGLSALLVIPLIRLQNKRDLIAKEYLFPGITLAFLFSAEFLLVAEALRYTSAAHTVVLLYTAPIFVALGLHWKIPEEKLTIVQWVGIFLAFAGIVLAFMGRDQNSTGHAKALLGDFYALLAGVMWALTTIALKLSKLSEAPATQTLFYQLVGGFIFLMPIAYFTGQTEIHWTAVAISSLIFHVFIMSFMSLMLWFWLLRHYLANGLGVFSFLTPILGVIFGVVFLDETIELNFIVGTALVMFGVLIVTIHRSISHVFQRLSLNSE